MTSTTWADHAKARAKEAKEEKEANEAKEGRERKERKEKEQDRGESHGTRRRLSNMKRSVAFDLQ